MRRPKDRRRRELVRRLVSEHDSLQVRELQLLRRAEAIVAVRVAAELGEQPEDVCPRFVGAAVTATIAALGRDDNRPVDAESVDAALAFLEAGMNALRLRVGPTRRSE